MQLSPDAILVVGGTGAIGRLTTQALRSGYPDLPFFNRRS
jgi:putative cell wall-binding protein